jgi:hypothetical protein
VSIITSHARSGRQAERMVKGFTSLWRRSWPAAFLIIALIVNALWIATLGYALARLI